MMFADLVDQVDFLQGLSQRGVPVDVDTPMVEAMRIVEEVRGALSDEQLAQLDAFFVYLKSDQVTLHPDVADVLP